MKAKHIFWTVLILGAGFAAYKLLTKKKTETIQDRNFEIEVEVDEPKK
jgi:NADH dehydrogenase FAD-containing subunit